MSPFLLPVSALLVAVLFLGAAPARGDDAGLMGLAVSADGKLAVTGGQAGVVRVWDLTTERQAQAVEVGHPVEALALTADGKRFAAGCANQAGVRLYAR